MEQIKNKVIDLLKRHGMDYEDIDIEQNCRIFLDEMERGLKGQDSSLEMIPTYIEINEKVPINEPVIVIDAGGTNFRRATVYFNRKREPVIENLPEKPYPMPGSKGKVSKKEFFQTMAGYIEDIIHKSPNIGFCFSYPTEIFPNKDGKAIRFSKEIKAPEVIGQMIGENLIRAIRTSGYKGDKHIVILNDTVTALLAGICSFAGRTFDSYVGFILGTGTNCCYIENNMNITKNKDLDPSKSQIINVESGGFARGPRGIIDRQFDESTANPGQQTFEKMISGAYLGPLCLKVIQVAAEDGLFSDTSAQKLKNINQISTKDVSDFMCYPMSNALLPRLATRDAEASNRLSSAVDSATEDDTMTLYYLVDRLLERAAKLTAINLSSVAIKSGKGRNPCRPVCIVAEGTTFYHLKSLKQRVQYYLKQYLQNQKNIYYEIASVENATLIGAAIAGLTN